MTRIGIISDTHGFLDEAIFKHFENCDEIWHAGDFGHIEIANKIIAGKSGGGGNLNNGRMTGHTGNRQGLFNYMKTTQTGEGPGLLKGVYGNIDGNDVRTIYPEQLNFMCEEIKVMMRHIGGSPPTYNPATRKELALHQPQLFICGHSHILKVIYDDKLNCLHINPGAAGKQGWHKVRTIITLVIDGKDMKDCKVIELGKR